ncbi:MAG: DUF1287 domain-containing protein [Marinosulfonomonas sp.]|nr:DUF1287 domain-containing protein [Marinosulfonomonas sp.]
MSIFPKLIESAHGLDLQTLVNRDMKANFSAYPEIRGLSRTDSNIDHRRAPNLQTYFNVAEHPCRFLMLRIITCPKAVKSSSPLFNATQPPYI